MALNRKCPRCGSTKVQMSSERSKHGCLWLILFGIYYICWIMIKWMIGFMLLIMLDWWIAIIKAAMGKGYVWKCKGWFSGVRRYYYCHNCGYNFKV